jgi:hypothetical protein
VAAEGATVCYGGPLHYTCMHRVAAAHTKSAIMVIDDRQALRRELELVGKKSSRSTLFVVRRQTVPE